MPMDSMSLARNAVVFLAAGIQSRGDEPVEFVIEPYGLVLGIRLHPLDGAEHHAHAHRGKDRDGRRPRTRLAMRIHRRQNNRILRRANHNPPLGQIHRDFLIARLLRECGRGEEPQMHTDEHG